MRTNNAKVKNVIVSTYFVLILVAILAATVFSAFAELTPNPNLTFFVVFFGFVLAFGMVHQISKYFEYDSDGMKVVIINRGLLLADYFNYREHKVEFEKQELKAFKFHNFWIYKNLIIYLKSPNGKTRSERFNLTLVSRKKRRYVKQSLSKMVKINKKVKEE